MVVRNAEQYLRAAVESILGQNFGDFELLVVDDASTDSSREILRSFRDQRIRVIENGVHQGVSSARNQGLHQARAEYVAVLDSDDIAHPDRLGVQSAFLDEHRDVCLVGGSYEIIDELGRVKGIQGVPTDAWTIRWRLLFANVLGHSTIMYRRSDVLAVGAYDPALSYGEDYDLWVRLAPHHKFIQQDRPLTSYRVHEASTTHRTADPAKEGSILSTVRKAIEQLIGRPIDARVARILAHNVQGHSATAADLASACNVLEECLRRLISDPDVLYMGRHHFVSAAWEDLRRMGDRYPDAREISERTALRLMARYDPVCLCTRRGLRAVARAILPDKARHMVRRVRHAAWRRNSQATGG